MNIAFIGHAYHRTTRSADFFVQLLEEMGKVDCFYDDSLDGGRAIELDRVSAGYDLIVVWQIEYVVPLLVELGLANIVFAPMYDGCMGLSKKYWQALNQTRILCFSARLYEKLQKLGCNCVYAQYCPDVANVPALTKSVDQGLSGFFWYRRDALSIGGLSKLAGNLGLATMTVQYSPDPCETAIVDKAVFMDSLGIPVSFVDWRADRAEYLRQLAYADIYMAPRLFEGIGLSFLEAMSLGRVVVAPDNPTMNEYLIHGYNGILYDPSRYEWYSCELEFETMAVRARMSIEKGHALWLGYRPYLVDWLTGKTSERSCFYDKIERVASLGPGTRGDSAAGSVRRLNRNAETLTVATVVRNAVDDIETTISSVISQTYPDTEYVVVDGASTDGTLDVIRRYSNHIDHFVSEPDGGTYDAMNKAASLATNKWIIFINAGDRFIDEDSLSNLLCDIPEYADFVVGHHVYRTVRGARELHRVNDFDVTYSRLVSGDVDGGWLQGVPCHQATAIRAALLAQKKYRLEFPIAADHEFMFRCKRDGAKFHLSNSFVSVYESGGASWTNAVSCIGEWREIALEFTDYKARINRFYDSVLAHHHVATLENLPLAEAMKYMMRYPTAAKAVFTSLRHLRALPRHLLNKLFKRKRSSDVIGVGELSK